MPADRSSLLTLVLVSAIGLAIPAAAQTVGKPAVAEKAGDAKAAEAAKAFAAGTQAFEKGKTDAAILALSVAISTGGLKNSDLAKAMFYRGVAYRTGKKPAAALSDLNAAVWLREGLSAADKAVAEDHRQALLREVAALNGAPVGQTNAVAAASPEPEVMPWATASAAPTSPPQAEQQSAAPAPPVAETAAAAPVEPTHDTIATPVAAVAPVERATLATVQAEPAPPERPLPWQTASSEPAQDAAPTSTAAPLPWSAPASAPPAAASVIAAAPAALADAGTSAGAFVSSLFGGGAAAPEADPAQPAAVAQFPVARNVSMIETAALPDRSEPAAPAPAVWTVETAAAPVTVAAEPQPPAPPAEVMVATAKTTPPAEALPTIAVLPGPYRLQIAAENSRADAEQTLSRLISGHRASLRGLDPVIEEPATGGVLFGSMGAAYRVSIGPYASSMEPGRLCNILQPHGFDCRVVAVAP